MIIRGLDAALTCECKCHLRFGGCTGRVSQPEALPLTWLCLPKHIATRSAPLERLVSALANGPSDATTPHA